MFNLSFQIIIIILCTHYYDPFCVFLCLVCGFDGFTILYIYFIFIGIFFPNCLPSPKVLKLLLPYNRTYNIHYILINNYYCYKV